MVCFTEFWRRSHTLQAAGCMFARSLCILNCKQQPAPHCFSKRLPKIVLGVSLLSEKGRVQGPWTSAFGFVHMTSQYLSAAFDIVNRDAPVSWLGLRNSDLLKTFPSPVLTINFLPTIHHTLRPQPPQLSDQRDYVRIGTLCVLVVACDWVLVGRNDSNYAVQISTGIVHSSPVHCSVGGKAKQSHCFTWDKLDRGGT